MSPTPSEKAANAALEEERRRNRDRSQERVTGPQLPEIRPSGEGNRFGGGDHDDDDDVVDDVGDENEEEDDERRDAERDSRTGHRGRGPVFGDRPQHRTRTPRPFVPQLPAAPVTITPFDMHLRPPPGTGPFPAFSQPESPQQADEEPSTQPRKRTPKLKGRAPAKKPLTEADLAKVDETRPLAARKKKDQKPINPLASRQAEADRLAEEDKDKYAENAGPLCRDPKKSTRVANPDTDTFEHGASVHRNKKGEVKRGTGSHIRWNILRGFSLLEGVGLLNPRPTTVELPRLLREEIVNEAQRLGPDSHKTPKGRGVVDNVYSKAMKHALEQLWKTFTLPLDASDARREFWLKAKNEEFEAIRKMIGTADTSSLGLLRDFMTEEWLAERDAAFVAAVNQSVDGASYPNSVQHPRFPQLRVLPAPSTTAPPPLAAVPVDDDEEMDDDEFDPLSGDSDEDKDGADVDIAVPSEMDVEEDEDAGGDEEMQEADDVEEENPDTSYPMGSASHVAAQQDTSEYGGSVLRLRAAELAVLMEHFPIIGEDGDPVTDPVEYERLHRTKR